MGLFKRVLGNRLFKYTLLIGVIVIAAACCLRFGVLNKNYFKKSTITSSSLMKTMDIAELSTGEFKYRGIAEIYTNEKKEKVRCRVCYNASVKAGIDMSKLQLEVDNTDKKTVTVHIPEITLTVTIIDEESMALLPSDAKLEVSEMLIASKEDAEAEALQSQELLDTARENVKATIEALLYPVLKTEGYTLVWN